MKKILLLGLVFLAAACSRTTAVVSTPIPESQNTIADGGFLTKRPCGPPCFYGIVPGTTTVSQAGERMENSGTMFSHCKPFDFSSMGGRRGADCDYVNLGYQGDIVSMVSFSPDIVINMQAVLDNYGPPSLISVGIIALPDKPDKTRMVLYLDSIHSMLQLLDQDGNEYNVSPETKVSSVIYLSIDRYKEIRDLPGNLSWQGFKSYVGTR